MEGKGAYAKEDGVQDKVSLRRRTIEDCQGAMRIVYLADDAVQLITVTFS
jgi:hypothetical protein